VVTTGVASEECGTTWPCGGTVWGGFVSGAAGGIGIGIGICIWICADSPRAANKAEHAPKARPRKVRRVLILTP
jgi:hypothetical protein